jgi:hypothetical protein
MGAHVKRDFNVTSTPVGRMTVNGKIPWPTRPSGSSSKSTNMNHGMDRQSQVVTVPDFVSKPQAFFPSKYGYQEVHGIYDEMRNFFAKRASAYQNEVATIKVTLMSMKPNNRNPQMVMVCKITVLPYLTRFELITIHRTSQKQLRTFLLISGSAISKRSLILLFFHLS